MVNVGKNTSPDPMGIQKLPFYKTLKAVQLLSLKHHRNGRETPWRLGSEFSLHNFLVQPQGCLFTTTETQWRLQIIQDTQICPPTNISP